MLLGRLFGEIWIQRQACHGRRSGFLFIDGRAARDDILIKSDNFTIHFPTKCTVMTEIKTLSYEMVQFGSPRPSQTVQFNPSHSISYHIIGNLHLKASHQQTWCVPASKMAGNQQSYPTNPSYSNTQHQHSGKKHSTTTQSTGPCTIPPPHPPCPRCKSYIPQYQ